jgi:hypothetical protein
VAEDEEFVTRKKYPRIGDFLSGDNRDRVAFSLFRVAFDEDAGGGMETSHEIHLLKSLYYYPYPLTPDVCVGDGGLCGGASVSVSAGMGVKVGGWVGMLTWPLASELR